MGRFLSHLKHSQFVLYQIQNTRAALSCFIPDKALLHASVLNGTSLGDFKILSKVQHVL